MTTKVPSQPAAPTVEQMPTDTERALASFVLVQAAQNGDVDAFAQIYVRYHPRVFRFVFRRVIHRQTAEDLTAETFLRAWKRIGLFVWQGRDVGAWLNTIAHNLVADHWKSRRHRLEVLTVDVYDTTVEPATADTGGAWGIPERSALDRDVAEALVAGIKQLSPDQREVLELRFICGLSVVETAAAMGKNVGAVKALQFRAVRSMARLLPQELRDTP